MTRITGIALGLLVGSNAAWAVAWHTRSKDEAGAARDVAALQARVFALEADLATARAVPALVGPAQAESPPQPEGAAAAPPVPTAEQKEAWRRAKEARERAAQEAADASRDAQTRVDAWKADVLQIEDPDRRERGLAAIDAGIRAEDPRVAVASLRTLHALRDVSYDKARFGPAVRSRLADDDAQVRSSAMHALLSVGVEPGDLDAVLDVIEAHPEDGALIAAAWVAKGRVEGRLADLYVRALTTGDAREANNVANQLRGMWVAQEVEDAVIAAWRREGGVEGRGWWHILGQIQPTREARVRLIFEVLKKDDTSAPQLLKRALEPANLEGPAARLAADLASEGLAQAPNALIRRLHLSVLERSGTASHAALVRAFSDNPMVAEDLRRQAAVVADTLDRRP